MKKSVSMMMIFGLSVICLQAMGQTAGEWLRQKSTQRKYLLQQIAALRTYSGYLKKGYDVVKDGSGLIKELTGGEFNLHKDYFESLKNVNPALLKNKKVETMLSLQQWMGKSRRRSRENATTANYFSTGEIQSLRKVLEGLEQDCDDRLEELLLVISDGKLEMSDEQRIKRIDNLYKTMQHLYGLHRKTESTISTLKQHREREIRELELLRKMQGLK
ncbi:MAG: hypothetical protein BGO31_05460 [Bacteroidetes bacterium 43-16]|uniref:hypothetical protein n=1 Tax=uncultured Dysgonomonas sp. TaxID=206096 RepID=UPI00092BC56C|nr:hypothetical protein [uncultured Dysgonomonas sp.]OJV52278.1 MAG: hypothetical protein BGO31_05460 [Bacteroidetes bacterium 43-16]